MITNEMKKLNQDSFEKLLTKYRPTNMDISVGRRTLGDGSRSINVFADGVVIHRTKPLKKNVTEQQLLAIEEELISYYSNPPRIWPGCRGVIAKHFGIKLDKDFHSWFDKFANAEDFKESKRLRTNIQINQSLLRKFANAFIH